MNARRPLLAAGCVLTLWPLLVAAQSQPPKLPTTRTTSTGPVTEGGTPKLTACQSAQADVLRLRQATAEMRRTIVSLQAQIEQIRAPGDQQAVEAGWKALEKDAGCALDRTTGACRADAPQEGSKP